MTRSTIMSKETWEIKGYDKIRAAGDALKTLHDTKNSIMPETYLKAVEIAVKKLQEGLEEI